MPAKKHTPLNWSPHRTNPIDFIASRAPHKIYTPDGKEVVISQSGIDFVVTIGDERIETGSNVNTCYVLNYREVGV